MLIEMKNINRLFEYTDRKACNDNKSDNDLHRFAIETGLHCMCTEEPVDWGRND